MKLIGCDRCRTVFPRDAQHTALWLFDTVGDEMDLHVPEPSDSRELCPSCRADLDAFLAGTPDDAARTDAGPAVKTKRKSPTWSKEHTCEICGRTGVQRFIQTPTGWRCSPTAVKCPGNQAASDIPAKQFAADVTPPEPPKLPRVPGEPPSERPSEPAPADPPPDQPPMPPGVTARCKDCTRTWNLTGFILQKAVEMHELKHGHIVDILDNAGAA
ncbi:hypothetical protein [Mycobacterium avium]|uniref:hypothetical protein n=1 Tax=Mycobacterium avium TaxID=1764 RepID=UPI001CC9F925|nr:hypothetical protein [Mycobacterium avium]MBZ4574677.1 hypothetical protein [Mycobacterium avium subsp. hominissuis]